MTESYICIDLETTGLYPKRDRIIEIGAVRIEKGVEVQRFETFVNPKRRLDERIVALTGITQEQVEQAPAIGEVLPSLCSFLGEEVLVGHNIRFDYAFLKKAAVDARVTFEKQGIDTLKIARKYLSGLEHRNLEYLCQYYQIPHRAHRALADARATAALYQHLAQAFYSGEEALFRPAPLLFQIKRDTPATKAQKERLYKLLSLHKIEIAQEIESLTRSEASRITDKILAEYGR